MAASLSNIMEFVHEGAPQRYRQLNVTFYILVLIYKCFSCEDLLGGQELA